ncbi:hypothetical protein HSB1_33220 [Halogranum salarium B-1]|uniref:Uncharacterized protein n=1 Tax=Halogranum salarium B-1 TaxID=1210908 RepID=J2ZB76_9EURY|nr:hypothetical protein HSB1_33220 [Halogranum salarium B-1]
MRPGHVSAYGYQLETTSNIDRLRLGRRSGNSFRPITPGCGTTDSTETAMRRRMW